MKLPVTRSNLGFWAPRDIIGASGGARATRAEARMDRE